MAGCVAGSGECAHPVAMTMRRIVRRMTRARWGPDAITC
jgi:hypothetical protein